MANNTPKISVIMPVFNSGTFLSTAVDSILDQSLKDFELILVDDGSTDGSSKICDDYAKKDSRVNVIHKKNGGICSARNVALKIARGEYIAFCDHDDEYLPKLLQCAYDRATNDNAEILKFCKKEVYLLNGINVKTRYTKLDDKSYNNEEIKKNVLTLLNEKVLECVWDGIYKRVFLLENSIFFDEFYKSGGEDIDILLRMFVKVKNFSTMKDLFYIHYIRAGFSTSAKFNQNKLSMCQRLGETITQKCIEMQIPLSDYKYQYIRQIMFSMFNSSASILASPHCTLEKKQKKNHLKNLISLEFIPQWFFNGNILNLYKVDKKIALSYFLLKNKFFDFYLLLFRLRQKQLDKRACK